MYRGCFERYPDLGAQTEFQPFHTLPRQYHSAPAVNLDPCIDAVLRNPGNNAGQ